MPHVTIPGVGDVTFPDSMSPDDINAAAKRLYTEAQPRSWSDVAHDAVQGVKHFVTGGFDTGELGHMLEPLAHPQTASDFGNLALAGAPGSGFLGFGGAGTTAGKGLSAAATGVADAAKAAPAAVGNVLKTGAGMVDPDLVGLASPRLAHTIRYASKVGNVLTRSAPDAAPAADVLPTAAPAMAAPEGASSMDLLGDSTLLAQKAARNQLRRNIGGFISQASGGDPDMTAHLQNYANSAIEKSLNAGQQPDPEAIWNAIKGEARGYRSSSPVADPGTTISQQLKASLAANLPKVSNALEQPIDVGTAMHGAPPSPAGVGHAVQTLGSEQVKGTLKRLGEQPLWDAFEVMTGAKK